jgi:hypothetical protein
MQTAIIALVTFLAGAFLIVGTGILAVKIIVAIWKKAIYNLRPYFTSFK